MRTPLRISGGPPFLDLPLCIVILSLLILILLPGPLNPRVFMKITQATICPTQFLLGLPCLYQGLHSLAYYAKPWLTN